MPRQKLEARWRFARRKLPAFAAAWLLAGACLAEASEHAAPAEHGAEKETDAARNAGTFNLGKFDIKDFRPTHRKAPHIQFALYLVVDEQATAAARKELADWKERMRDQAIIALRSADPHALAEAKLSRIQRLILFRLQRLPLPAQVTRLYITDFSVTEVE